MNQDLSRNGKEERPLSAEETAGFAEGDPFKEHDLPEDFATAVADGLARPDRHKNAAGKKLCGMCANKTKGEWRCESKGFPASDLHCPAISECRFFFPNPTVQRPPQPKKKCLPVPPGVKFLYFGQLRGKTKKGVPQHQGIVTVAWSEPSPGTLHLGFSFCSPKDPWHKTTGRDIALTRLLRPVVIPFLYSPRRTVHEVARAVMSHDFVRLAAIAPGGAMWGGIPSWTKGLAKKMWPTRRPQPRITFISTPRQVKRLFSKYCVDEAMSMVPTEVWRPRPSPLNILTRMAFDIAKLGRATD